MDKKQLKELGVELDVPFLKLLGVRCLRADLGEGEVVLSLKPEHNNSWEVAHGGVLLTLMDVGMAIAARAADTGGRGVVTIELKTNFMQAAKGIIRVAAKTVHVTATLAFVEAKLYDERDAVCCMGSATFKYFKELPAKKGTT
ncbi:PaaI family thioesterase [Polynucleobacter sp. 30F-ANTBAC]|uniref:PaaI family thioesterase n=1 Tax=Polynucleobacter sp. 30F-ANTBAC TaxID=2689095 RepID=UPI001C0D50F6|nr:PaaI family thioesterase [Polynucleobacter sp. 30F-ANTBAC]MBU3599100.1 PaaI family thioesterase [Polynucleobacter sp. 30F-ANTBAC]